MARRNSPTVNAVRYFLFAVGVLLLIGKGSREMGMVDAFALAFVIVGFPYFLLDLVVRLFVWLFRFVVWLLRLFGIVKRKPAPVPQVKVAVEWADTPATDKQLGFIRHLGGNPPDGLTKSAASDMIDALLAEKRGRT